MWAKSAQFGTRQNELKCKITRKSKMLLHHLCGPIGIETYSGEKKFILFVDDYSRMMTVMYLKDKYEV